VAERVRVRDITSQEGNRLLRIVRRSSGSVCPGGGPRWCWVAAKPWTSPQIARVGFASPDRVRDVLHNLQPGWVLIAVPALPRRPPTNLHPGSAPSGQAARPVPAPGS
jgi:hypothetical protein